MKRVEPRQQNQDPTIFGVFHRVLPVEIVLQHGGDHLKTEDAKVEAPAPRATRSTLSSPPSLPIWQDEYKS